MRRSRLTATLAVALLAGGCGSSDPETSRIPQGSRAMLSAIGGGNAAVVFSDAVPDIKKDPVLSRLVTGTEVQVESDSGKPDLHKPPDSPTKRDHRWVSVLVLDGAFKGRRGYALRFELRPVASK